MSQFQPTDNPGPPPLPYRPASAHRRPFRIASLLAGIATPYAYACAALFVVGLFTSQRSAFEAFYALEPSVIVALAAFPVLVWWVARRLKSRGFVLGVVAGILVIPVIAVIALAIGMMRP